MTKNILLIDLHPDKESFCSAITDNYFAGAKESGQNIQKLVVRDLNFDPILHFGYRAPQELEPDLVNAQQLITECNHLVLVTPLWWGTLPALAKGFFDRTFTSGFSHKFDTEKNMPVSLLNGKSASVIYTQGAPKFYSFLFKGDAFWKVCKNSILDFAGFKPVKRKCFDNVKSGTDKDRENILKTVFELGAKGF